MITLHLLFKKTMALMLSNSHGRTTMLPCHQITRFVNVEQGHLLVILATRPIFFRYVATSFKNKRSEEKIDSASPTVPVHYIPHHHVNKDSKTTPIRIVYDCSCQLPNNHPSLNDCLETGPSLVNDLCSILLRFRVHKIALSTDIEKAFLHVKLDAKDQDFTRYLWLLNPENAESDFDTYRFKVVLFGSASSPFMLSETLRLHLSKYNSQLAHDMKQNLYVDNVITGCSTEELAIQYFYEARKIMFDANFNLRSWETNSQQL